MSNATCNAVTNVDRNAVRRTVPNPNPFPSLVVTHAYGPTATSGTTQPPISASMHARKRETS